MDDFLIFFLSLIYIIPTAALKSVVNFMKSISNIKRYNIYIFSVTKISTEFSQPI